MPREAPGVIAEGIHGIRDASAADFLVINFTLGFARKREAQQLQSVCSGRQVGIQFEGRLGDGNEKKPVQAEFFVSRLRDEQMAEMNRIERTAIEAEFHVKRCGFKVTFNEQGATQLNRLEIIEILVEGFLQAIQSPKGDQHAGIGDDGGGGNDAAVRVEFEVVKSQGKQDGGTAHKVRHGGRHGGADIGAELFGGDGGEDRPVADAETESKYDQIKCAVGQAAGEEIGGHGCGGEQEKAEQDFPPRLQHLAEITAGKSPRR